MVNIIGLGSIDITRICIFVVFIKKSNMTFNMTFNLKNYLLGLYSSLATKLGFESMGIFYCENANTHKIELIGNDSDEEIKINLSFCNHRVSSEQNRKINEIAEGLKSGKIIGKKIIANAFDLNARYCFITSDDLKNLKERLLIGIINAIKQKKRVALDHAHIDDIQYNVLDSAFYFIFDVGNPLLKKPSQLIVEVPREALDLENADRLVKIRCLPIIIVKVLSCIIFLKILISLICI